MINRLIGGFVGILIGVSLISPIATQVNTATATGSHMANVTSWGATVLNLVPGFFALGILGIGIAVTYGALRDAGVV
jgi:flagellar motor component MotA